MVAIAPFHALRYNPQRFPDLSDVLCPPYDVITPEEQERLYARAPENFIRLEYGKASPEDPATNNRYTRAKQLFADWRAQQVLVQDPKPGVYVIEHTFTWQGTTSRRLGVMVRLDFEGSVPGGVFRHENTLSAPKADRTNLLDAVRAQLSPIFCVAPDPDRAIFTFLDGTTRTTPTATARIHDQQVRMWAVTDPASIASLQQRLKAVGVLIADGHHRFEVSLSRRDQVPGVMAHVSVLEDPSMQIQPIHRVVPLANGAAAALETQVRALCRVEPAAGWDEVQRWLAGEQGPGRFGWFLNGTYHRVTVTPEAVSAWQASSTFGPALTGLDVTILQYVLLKGIVDSPQAVTYTADPAHAVTLAKGPRPGSVFFLRPLGLQHVYDMARDGVLLPPKSTYFYPKVPSGLTINPFDGS